MAEATNPTASIEALRAHPRVHMSRKSLGEAPRRRIVSLVPSLSEALHVLGLGDRIVGVTDYCVHPADAFEGVARVGGTKDADVDAIEAVAPDLVIANEEENTVRVVRKLAERDLDVWITYPRGCAMAPRSSTSSQILARATRRVRRTSRRVSKRSPGPSARRLPAGRGSSVRSGVIRG